MMLTLISSFLKFFRDSISRKGTNSLSIINETQDEFPIKFLNILSKTLVIFSLPAFLTILVMKGKNLV